MISTAHDSICQIQSKDAAQEHTIADLADEMKRLREKDEDVAKVLNAHDMSIQSAVQTSQSARADLDAIDFKALSKHMTSQNSLVESVDSLKSSYATLNGDVSVLEDELKALTSTNDDVARKLAELTNTNSMFELQLADLSNANNNLTTKIADLEAANETHTQGHASLDAQLTALTSINGNFTAELKASNENLSKANAALNEDVSVLFDERDVLVSHLSAANARIDKLEGLVRALTGQAISPVDSAGGASPQMLPVRGASGAVFDLAVPKGRPLTA